ncbi:short-chain dehydrogenase reductase [Cyanidiococcus yangmingshanensis]|uniref:Short-chain dehydrogenase reductase n=1 Tax=Cyanidiococcus yangmingshanensis TaxID=2690220 RepID=A0A7J7ILT2_9RHOD|nr:short-chain dehydrogenase reductase [Cyanidiococcus yangmingshanensis]
MDFRADVLQGKVAVVTGASRGIGAAIADCFLEAGVSGLVLISREQTEFVHQLRKRAELKGSRVGFYSLELEDTAAVERCAEQILQDWSQVDILVNNAGLALLNPLTELSIGEWERTMAVNVRAPFLLARKFVRESMIPRGVGGKIINISSVASLGGVSEHAAYCSSKAALNSLTKTMAIEWGPYGIQCNVVCPSIIMTDMGRQVWEDPEKHGPVLARVPIGRFANPPEIARVVLFLASPENCVVNGQCIAPDGGYTAGL